MAYDTKLADRVREYLVEFPALEIEEKKMFSGLTFMVNGKMCVGVSGENLMCRFDPNLHEEIAGKRGYESLMMKGKEYKGFCFINPDGIKTKNDLEYFVDLCLDYNKIAKSSKKNRTEIK